MRQPLPRHTNGAWRGRCSAASRRGAPAAASAAGRSTLRRADRRIPPRWGGRRCDRCRARGRRSAPDEHLRAAVRRDGTARRTEVEDGARRAAQAGAAGERSARKRTPQCPLAASAAAQMTIPPRSRPHFYNFSPASTAVGRQILSAQQKAGRILFKVGDDVVEPTDRPLPLTDEILEVAQAAIIEVSRVR